MLPEHDGPTAAAAVATDDGGPALRDGVEAKDVVGLTVAEFIPRQVIHL